VVPVAGEALRGGLAESASCTRDDCNAHGSSL
jgi:hypothetical protein